MRSPLAWVCPLARWSHSSIDTDAWCAHGTRRVFEGLIERSSLGTPTAKKLRALTTDAEVDAVREFLEELIGTTVPVPREFAPEAPIGAQKGGTPRARGVVAGRSGAGDDQRQDTGLERNPRRHTSSEWVTRIKEAGKLPYVEHKHLVAFAKEKVNLTREEVDDQRDQVERLRSKIQAKIAATLGYGLVKSLHAGSVAKGTALRNVNDRDLAIYVRAEAAPGEIPALVTWLRDRVVEAYPTLGDDQIVANTNCVTVTFAGTGLTVDLVPVLYEGEPNDIGYLVSKDTGEKLKTSVRQHLDFIRGRKRLHPVHLAQLIRFTKWWVRQERKRDTEFKCKSFMLELIWVFLADTGVPLNDYPLALESFFAFVVKGLTEQIAFTEFLSVSEIPARSISAIEVLDPVNFENNVARRYTEEDRVRLVEAAQRAYDAITTARFVPTKTEAIECWQDVLGSSFKGSL